MPSWPHRRYVCVSCRRLMVAAERCDCPRADRVDLLSAAEVERLRASVWRGADAADDVHQRVAAVVMVSSSLTIVLLMISPVLVPFVFAASVVGSSQVLRLRRGPKPHGAWRLPATERQRRLVTAPVIGTVTAGAALPSPLHSLPCVGYAVTLHHRRALDSSTVLRDARCDGFTIATDDGCRVEVPAGPIDFLADSGSVACHRSRHLLDSYWSSVACCEGADPHEVFPHDRVSEQRIALGDRVALYNELASRADPNAPSTLYRESAVISYAPLGRPRVERIA